MKLPRNTCPNIDACISLATDLASLCSEDDSYMSGRNLESIIGYLEDLRTANSELRAAATEAVEELERANDTIDELEKKLCDANNELEYVLKHGTVDV